MWSTLKVSESRGSFSPSLVSYSPRMTEILLSLALWTQCAAVAMYQWLRRTPPHWYELMRIWACQGNSENFAFSPPIILLEKCGWRETPHSGSWSKNSCFLEMKDNVSRWLSRLLATLPFLEEVLLFSTCTNVGRLTARIKKWITAWKRERGYKWCLPGCGRSDVGCGCWWWCLVSRQVHKV